MGVAGCYREGNRHGGGCDLCRLGNWLRSEGNRAVGCGSCGMEKPEGAPFFATFGMASVLLAAIVEAWSLPVAAVIWVIGVLALFACIFLLWRRWMHEKQDIGRLTPAWLLILISPLTIPVAGNSLKLFGYQELTLFSLSIGLASAWQASCSS